LGSPATRLVSFRRMGQAIALSACSPPASLAATDWNRLPAMPMPRLRSVLRHRPDRPARTIRQPFANSCSRATSNPSDEGGSSGKASPVRPQPSGGAAPVRAWRRPASRDNTEQVHRSRSGRRRSPASGLSPAAPSLTTSSSRPASRRWRRRVPCMRRRSCRRRPPRSSRAPPLPGRACPSRHRPRQDTRAC